MAKKTAKGKGAKTKKSKKTQKPSKKGKKATKHKKAVKKGKKTKAKEGAPAKKEWIPNKARNLFKVPKPKWKKESKRRQKKWGKDGLTVLGCAKVETGCPQLRLYRTAQPQEDAGGPRERRCLNEGKHGCNADHPDVAKKMRKRRLEYAKEKAEMMKRKAKKTGRKKKGKRKPKKVKKSKKSKPSKKGKKSKVRPTKKKSGKRKTKKKAVIRKAKRKTRRKKDTQKTFF